MTDLIGFYTALEHAADPVYVLTRERRIVRTNPAYARFAMENGGQDVLTAYAPGACIDDAMSPVLREFYRRAFDRALATGERFEHEYDCDSSTIRRRFRMVAYPFAGEFLVVVNMLELTRAHTDRQSAEADTVYLTEGAITMCAHCRHTRRGSSPVRWDWVPSYVARMPPNTRHGLCDTCSRYYALR